MRNSLETNSSQEHGPGLSVERSLGLNYASSVASSDKPGAEVRVMRKGRLRCVGAAGGLAMGGLLGHAIGLFIRSDNLPFFDALGVAAGWVVGVTAFCSRSHSRRRRP